MNQINIELISRDFLPDNIFIPKNKNDTDEVILKVSFYNGLDYYVSCNNLVNNLNEIIKNLNYNFLLFKSFSSPDDIQNYFYYAKNRFVKYKDCQKLFEYYSQNQEKIIEILILFDTVLNLKKMLEK